MCLCYILYSLIDLSEEVTYTDVKGIAIPVTDRLAHRLMRRRGFHTFKTVGSQTALTVSALRTG
jgi:hypothetical protein